MPVKILFPDRTLAEIIARYESGQSMKDIADWIGCGKNTVRRVLLENDIPQNKVRSLSTKLKGRTSPRKGVVLSQETKRKISAAGRGIARTTGYRFSKESKRRMSEARLDYLRRNPHGMDIARAAALKAIKLPESERAARIKVRRFMKQSLRRCLLLTGRLKTSRTEAMLGYSQSELRRHIEKQFSGDMSWDRRDLFHIDHIKPIKHFLDNGVADPRIINALANLQVLTPKENQRKSAS